MHERQEKKVQKGSKRKKKEKKKAVNDECLPVLNNESSEQSLSDGNESSHGEECSEKLEADKCSNNVDLGSSSLLPREESCKSLDVKQFDNKIDWEMDKPFNETFDNISSAGVKSLNNGYELQNRLSMGQNNGTLKMETGNSSQNDQTKNTISFEALSENILPRYKKNLVALKEYLMSNNKLMKKLEKVDNINQILINCLSRKKVRPVKNEKKILNLLKDHPIIYLCNPNIITRNLGDLKKWYKL